MDFSLGQLETGTEIKINQITAGPRLPRSEAIHHLMPASTPETAEMLSAYYPRRPAQRPMGFTKSLVLKTGVGCCCTQVLESLFLPLVALLGLLWIRGSGLHTEIVKSFPKFPQILAG